MKLILLFTLLSISDPSNGMTDSVRISLEEALQRVKVNNYDIQKALADLAVAKGQLNETNAAFLPSVTLSENFTNTNDPLNVFGFRLKQGITTTDDFNPIVLNDPDALDNWNTRIQVRQPIINPEYFALRGALKENYKATELQYQRQLQYVEYLVKKEYFQLWVTNEVIKSLTTSLASAKASWDLAKDNQDAGYLLESDVIAAELRYLELETQLEEASNQYGQLSDHFRFLLQLEGEGLLVPSDQIAGIDNLDNVPQQVPDSRNDLQALQMQKSSISKQLQSSKLRLLPTLNAQAAYEWNDSQVFGTGADNYLVGASLRWKIFDGQRNLAKIQQRKGQLRKVELTYDETKEKSNLELARAKKQYDVANSKVSLAERSLVRAERLFEIKKDRFEQGLEKSADLIEAESALSQSRVNLLQAKYQRLIAFYTIEFLTT